MNEEFAGLSLIELLDLLEPMPEPTPPSLWPATAGWLWLALALVTLLLWLGYRLRRQYAANAYRRAALAELAAAPDDPAVLAAILRRTALKAYSRKELAHLHGEPWLAFLDETYGGKAFSAGAGRAIASAPYQPSADIPGLRQEVANWVQRHRSQTVRR